MRTLAILIILSIIALRGAGAQDPEYDGGIMVGPTYVEADLQPGEVWDGKIRMACGEYTDRLAFSLEASDLLQTREGEKVPCAPGAGVRSAAAWLEHPAEVTVSRGQRIDVPLRLRCPPDAKGSYSALLVIRLRTDQPAAQMGAVIVPTVLVEILARVRSAGELSLRAEAVSYTSDPEPRLRVAVHNDGVWAADLAGDVLLYPDRGGFPERFELPHRSNGRPYSVYPGQTLDLVCAEGRPIPAGRYSGLVRLDLGQGRECRSNFSVEVASDGHGQATAAGDSELGTDLWVEPTEPDLELRAGAVRTRPVRVRNLGDAPIELEATIEEARVEPDGRWTFGGPPTTSLTTRVSPERTVIQPRRNAVFNVAIGLDREGGLTAPVSLALRLRGHAVGDDARPDPTRYDTGSLMLVSASDGGKPALVIQDLALIRSKPDKNPGGALLTLANLGDGVARPRGTFQLLDAADHVLASQDIGGDAGACIMPGRQRKFRLALPLLDAGNYRVVASLEDAGAPSPLDTLVEFASVERYPEELR